MLTVKNCENVKFSFSKLLENEIRRYRYMCTSRDFVTDKKMKIGTSNFKFQMKSAAIAHILGILLMNSCNTDRLLATTVVCGLSTLNSYWITPSPLV